jgi:tRNA dimethylallyltransferase
LCKIDPDYAKELHPNNLRYVIRALEVKMITGKSKRDFREEKTLKYDVLFLTPYIGNRELLYNRINKRVKMMFDEGLIQEVSTLLKKYNKNDF